MKCHNKWSSFKGICGDLTSPYVKGLQDQKLLVDYGTCNTISGHWYRGIACNLVAQCFGILRLFDFSFSDTKKVDAIGGLTIEYQYPRHISVFIFLPMMHQYAPNSTRHDKTAMFIRAETALSISELNSKSILYSIV